MVYLEVSTVPEAALPVLPAEELPPQLVSRPAAHAPAAARPLALRNWRREIE